MTHHRHPPRDRPPWWPASEPWPPTGPPSWIWRTGRRRFLWRVGFGIAILLVITSGAFTFIAWITASSLGLIARPVAAGPPIHIGLVGVLLTVIAIVLLIRTFRRAAAPIAELIEAAGHVESGDYSVRVAERGPLEVRALARAFNAMSAHLEASTQQRRSLLADVTHELRTPLTIIQGNIEGLIDGVYPADEQRLTELLDETRVLSRLVDDLRSLALAESGALTLRREPTDLSAVAAETAGTFRGSFSAAGVDLTVDAADGLPLLYLDPARIREVIENLLTNALRYTPEGGTVSVRCVVGSSREVVLRVEDTGRGIAPDELPRIFERFYRARDSGGTGLGLAIVKDLVEAHGGRVSARSSPGQGTVIECAFPSS